MRALYYLRTRARNYDEEIINFEEEKTILIKVMQIWHEFFGTKYAEQHQK